MIDVRWCAFEAHEGLFRIAATGDGVCRLSLPGEDAGVFFRFLALALRHGRLLEDPEGLRGATSEVSAFASGRTRELSTLVHLIGTPFQKAVWEEVRRVPFAGTVTYGELARRLGVPQSVRAVAGAVSANPVPILVPTHRVVSVNGASAGYGPRVLLEERLRVLEGKAL